MQLTTEQRGERGYRHVRTQSTFPRFPRPNTNRARVTTSILLKLIESPGDFAYLPRFNDSVVGLAAEFRDYAMLVAARHKYRGSYDSQAYLQALVLAAFLGDSDAVAHILDLLHQEEPETA